MADNQSTDHQSTPKPADWVAYVPSTRPPVSVACYVLGVVHFFGGSIACASYLPPAHSINPHYGASALSLLAGLSSGVFYCALGAALTWLCGINEHSRATRDALQTIVARQTPRPQPRPIPPPEDPPILPPQKP